MSGELPERMFVSGPYMELLSKDELDKRHGQGSVEWMPVSEHTEVLKGLEAELSERAEGDRVPMRSEIWAASAALIRSHLEGNDAD